MVFKTVKGILITPITQYAADSLFRLLKSPRSRQMINPRSTPIQLSCSDSVLRQTQGQNSLCAHEQKDGTMLHQK